MGGSYSIQKAAYAPPTADELVAYDEKDGPFYAVEPDSEIRIGLAKTGVASEAPTTVMAQLKLAAEKFGNHPALRVERGGDEKWIEWTWAQYYQDILCAARAFIGLGMKPYQAVNIIGFNSPEWLIANMAAIAAGGKAAGIYTTNGPDACRYITEHSEAAFVVCENKAQLDKFLGFRDTLPHLKGLIIWDGPVPEGANAAGKVPVYTWEAFMQFGKEGVPASDDRKAVDSKELSTELDARIAAQKPGHCCTLIYTSGTTGNPKAVMISHDNVTWTAKVVISLLPGVGTHSEVVVSYLPLSHIAAQLLDIHCGVALTAANGPTTVWFARPTALKGTLAITLKAAQPTVFFGVPRVWEKIRETMMKVASKTTGVKKRIATWAKNLGRTKYENSQVLGQGSLPMGVGLANTLVFSKVRDALGLSRARMCLTGAAPIAKEVLVFFGQLDVPIYEIYGMSESTGPQTSGRHGYFQAGSCGVTMPGMEIKIDHVDTRDKAGEGEICFRGRHIMMGYMKDPVKTQESIDAQGWLHSGDVGRLDANGLLYITGRIKELLITAGGENVAPVPVEDTIKEELPMISNVMMVGDRRKYNTCLVTLKTEMDEKTGGFTDALTKECSQVSEDSKTVAEAQKDPKWLKYIEDGIKRANKRAVSNAQKVQKFRILPRDFSVPDGELTATLKLKRPVVSEKYNDIIEEMYNEPDAEDEPARAPAAATGGAVAAST